MFPAGTTRTLVLPHPPTHPIKKLPPAHWQRPRAGQHSAGTTLSVTTICWLWQTSLQSLHCMKKAIDGAHYASLEDDSMSLVSASSASSGVV